MSVGWSLTGLVLSGTAAGIVNAIAGGGPIITLAGLTALGIDPRIASMTSTVALSPGQIVAGWSGLRSDPAVVAPHKPNPMMLATAAIGGGIGALVLLQTTPTAFQHLAPWLVLFATGVYTCLSRPRRERSASPAVRFCSESPVRLRTPRPKSVGLSLALALLGVYGGYFGGGNSFLVLSVIAIARPSHANPGALKNAFIAAMNCGACLVLVASSHVLWVIAVPLCAGGILGSWLGSRLVKQVVPGALRRLVILIGLLLSIWLFCQL